MSDLPEDEDDSLLRGIASAPSAAPPTEDERDARIGKTIRQKYTIDAVLGEGGMAIVYAATHRNRKRFAIKMLRRRASYSKDAQSRFVREGYVANTVNHPGAVVVLDDDVSEDGSAFIVMELLDGVPVDRLCETPMPVRAACDIGIQLLDVLAAAHDKGIVHRDIKPQNIFLERDGTVKVLDFGIARMREGPSLVDTTQSGVMIGTPAFMPPEQALGKTDEVDAQSDVWAVGATLFSMLSGKIVHEGDNGMMVTARAATTPARSLATVAPTVPTSIVMIVDRALAFEKPARWPNAAAMRDALSTARASLHDDTSTAEPRHLRRSSVRTIAIAFGLVMVTACIVFFARHTNERPQAPPPPETSVAIASNTEAASITAPAATTVATATASTTASVAPTRTSNHMPSAKPVPRCDPPYTIEPSGKRVPKPECL